MHPGRSLFAGLSALAALAASSSLGLATPATPDCGDPSFGFTVENRMGTTNSYGYEPGIEIDSKGMIWTTAHKLSLVREDGTRLSSFLHRSTDGGATFEDVQSLVPGAHPLWAFEGDLAVDGKDRMYFVDTWAADNHFYRFGPDGTFETARPLLPTAEVDDRPWLAAHHDGFVYYMSNTGLHPTGRLTIHRSTDRGETFDAGFVLPESGWGFLDADPRSDHVYAVVNDVFYGGGAFLGAAKRVFAWVSPDRGETWRRVKIADYAHGYNVTPDHRDGFPTVAVAPDDGTVVALWTDNGRAVMLARSTDFGESWRVYDVTPFEGRFSYPWVTMGADGVVGIVFEASRTGSNLQHIYAMQWRADAGCIEPSTGQRCEGPASVTARVNTRSIGTDPAGQADFFQTEISPTTGAQHVVWTGSGKQLWHARSLAAPSMGSRICGTVAP